MSEGEVLERQKIEAEMTAMRDDQMRLCVADAEARRGKDELTYSFQATRAHAELAKNRRLHRLEHEAQMESAWPRKSSTDPKL